MPAKTVSIEELGLGTAISCKLQLRGCRDVEALATDSLTEGRWPLDERQVFAVRQRLAALANQPASF